MKLYKKLSIFSILVPTLFFSLATHAELLVVKKDTAGYRPIIKGDPYQHIAAVLLRYQWPMCTASSDMTDDERHLLLTPGAQQAEELFIRKKLQEIDKNLDVIFIPTTLYELFTASLYSKEQTNPLRIAFKESLGGSLGGSKLDRKVTAILNDATLHPSTVHKKVREAYHTVNVSFYHEAFFRINLQLLKKLFELLPGIKNEANPIVITDEIKNNAVRLATTFLDDAIGNLYGETSRKLLYQHYEKNRDTANVFDPDTLRKAGEDYKTYPTFVDLPSTLQWKELTPIGLKPLRALARFITLEYKAREENRALIVRGSNPIKNAKLGIPEPKDLMVNSLDLLERHDFYAGYDFPDEQDLVKAYRNEKIGTVSLSFGNSLFAASIGDATGCVYAYLSNTSAVNDKYRANKACFALMVDKKAYVEHEEQRLLFISPLAPIAALQAGGDYFHSRTKGTIGLGKTKQETQTRGIEPLGVTKQFHDPAGVLIVHRNPLKHAALLSRFVANNIYVLKKEGVETDLPEDERKAYENKIKKNQRAAARYYEKVYLQDILKRKPQIKTKQQALAQLKTFVQNVRQKKQRTQKPTISKQEQKMPALSRTKKLKKDTQSMRPSSIWNENTMLDKKEKQLKFKNDCKRLESLNRSIPQKTDDLVRIATCNIHFWGNAQEKMAAIKALNADIIIIQEAARTMLPDLEEIGYIHHHYVNTAWAFGNAIVSRLPFTVVKDFKYERGDQEPRFFSHIVVPLPNGKQLNIYGTHLDAFDHSETVRSAQIQQLIDAIPETQENVMIAGDLNSIRREDYDDRTWELISRDFKAFSKIKTGVPQLVAHHLKRAGFQDNFTHAGVEKPHFTTWNGTMVDFLMLRNWNLKLAGSYLYYTHVSDHLPVIMDIIVEKPIQEHLASLQKKLQTLKQKLTSLTQKLGLLAQKTRVH